MLLEDIRRLYPRLTRSQKLIADFLVDHYHQVAFMSAADLARQTHLNDATVIRFAQRLGYRGYPEMADSVQELVKQELAGHQSVATHNDLLVEILMGQDESLQRAIRNFPVETAKDMVAAIQEAGRIFVLGQGMAAHLAGLLDCGLRMQGYDAHLVPGDLLSMGTAIGNITPGDLVIGLCLEDPSHLLANALSLAQQAGCRTLALANSPFALPAQVADLALTCTGNNTSEMPSITLMAAFIDALLQVLALDHTDAMHMSYTRIAKARAHITGDQPEV